MCLCESWTTKKAEHRRIDAFELWCWRRLLRVPWTARRFNQSILKEISPEHSLERLMLKLKLQYCGHLMQRTNSSKKPLMLGKIEGRRRNGWQRRRWLDALRTQRTWVWASFWRCWRTGKPGVLQAMRLQRLGHDWVTEQQSSSALPPGGLQGRGLQLVRRLSPSHAGTLILDLQPPELWV